MISVCIPTYNGQKYLSAQLMSILPQLGTNDEIVISDDSSTDGTIALIKQINDPRIRLLENGTFKSPVYNLENALRHAKGEYIFLSDQDDVWASEKVTTMMRYLKEFEMVISDCQVVDDQLQVVQHSFFETHRSGTGLIKNLLKNTYLGCCMAFRRSLLNKAMPFPPGLPMHDIWLGFVAEIAFKSRFIEEKLVFYRRHSGNVSSTSNKSPYSIWEKLRFRWGVIQHVFRILSKD